MAEGVCGPLESTIPAITVPAWLSMVTGHDPGELGLYGFRSAPMGFLALLRKLLRFWFEVYSERHRWSKPFLVPVQTAFLVVCLAGLGLAWPTHRAHLALPVLTVAYFMVVHTLTVATVRYMVPLFPILSLFATLALDRAWSRRSRPLADRPPGRSGVPRLSSGAG